MARPSATAQPELLNDAFDVLSYNGGHRTATGHHDPNGWVFNAFANSDAIHSTAQSDCDVVLKYKDDTKDFTLTHIIIRAPGNSNFPLKSALVWVTNSDPEVEAYTDQYMESPWSAQTVECHERAQPTKPVLGLFLQNTNDPMKNLQTVHEFDKWPTGKYIHLKFVEAHRLGGKSFIDVLYVGLVGFHGPGPKFKRFGNIPDYWNITSKDWKLIKPLHTDYRNLLYERPCFVGWYDDYREDACDKIRGMLTKIAENENVKGTGLQFFLHTAEKSWHQRDDDKKLLKDIQFDMKQELHPPAAIIIDRPKGQAFSIGHDVTVLNETNMTEFVMEWVNGSLKEFRGTEDIEEEDGYPEFPHTKRIVAAKYEPIVMDHTKDVLLYVYDAETEYTLKDYETESDYVMSGRHSVSVHWIIHKLGILLQNEPDIIVAAMNAHHNWVPKEFRQHYGVVVILPRAKSTYVTYPLQGCELKPSILLQAIVDHSGRHKDTLAPKIEDMLEMERFKLFYAPPKYIEGETKSFISRDTAAKGKAVLQSTMVEKKQLVEALEATTSRQDRFHMQCEYHILPINGATELIGLSWGATHDWICCTTRSTIPMFRTRGDPFDPNATDFPIKIPEGINKLATTLIVKWSSCGNYLVTAHANGKVLLWCVPSPGVNSEWKHIVMLANHNNPNGSDSTTAVQPTVGSSIPLCVQFSGNSEKLVCVYSDGFVYVWTVTKRVIDYINEADPEQIIPVNITTTWAERVARDVQWADWSPSDGKYLVVGSKFSVLVYKMEPKIEFDGYVQLSTSKEAQPMSSIRYDEIVAIHWCTPRPPQTITKPGLLIVFKSGNCQLMTKWSEVRPVLIETGLMATTAGWSPTGNFVAIGGTFLKEGDDLSDQSVPICAVKVFSVTGFLRGYVELPVEGAFEVSSLSWNVSSDRIAVCVDNQIYIIKLRGKLRRIVATKTDDPMLAISYLPSQMDGMKNTEMCIVDVQPQPRVLSPDLQNDNSEYSIFINRDLTGSYLNEQQIAELFAEIDHDGNGWITKDEFRRLHNQLEKFGVDDNDDVVEKWLKGNNMMGDDKLSFDEFAILMLKLAQQ